jgi:hypothetical protein
MPKGQEKKNKGGGNKPKLTKKEKKEKKKAKTAKGTKSTVSGL